MLHKFLAPFSVQEWANQPRYILAEVKKMAGGHGSRSSVIIGAANIIPSMDSAISRLVGSWSCKWAAAFLQVKWCLPPCRYGVVV